jgi:hypothetical protein
MWMAYISTTTFIPYAENDAAGHKIEFPDDSNWAEYQKTGGKLSRDDWRRSQVNSFIEAVGRAIKKIKPGCRLRDLAVRNLAADT